MNEALVELVFMMVILKIPVAYLCFVVYWAIKAEPRPLEGASRLAALGPDAGPDKSPLRVSPRREHRAPRPHGSPRRRYARRDTVRARARR